MEFARTLLGGRSDFPQNSSSLHRKFTEDDYCLDVIQTLKKSPIMKTKLFSRVGWFCVPSSLLGWFIFATAIAFCGTVFVAIDRHSHSASDTLYGVFPYFVCTFLVLDWVGRRSIENVG